MYAVGSFGCERGKFRTAEVFFPILIGGFGQSDGDFAFQVVGQCGVQRTVYARDEEAGHNVDLVDRQACRHTFGDTAGIGGVGFQGLCAGEQQGQVDADAFGHQRFQCFHARIGGRHFNHNVFAVDGGAQAFGFFNGTGRVLRQFGGNFEADETGFAAGGFVFGQTHVAGRLYVGNRHCFVTLFRGQVFLLQGCHFICVERVARECLLENRRIRGYAANALFQHLRQLTALYQRAGKVVQPDLLA